MIKAVYLEWEDHCSITPYGGGAWSLYNNVGNKPCKMKTIGFIVKEDKKYITICSCYDATSSPEVDTFKGVSVIIKSCITKRRRISV